MAKLAFMEPVPIDENEKKPEGFEKSYRFANQSWEMTLHLRRNKDDQLVIGGDSTLRNIDPSHRPQPLTDAKGEGLQFNVAQEQLRTRFEVRGEPVGWNEARAFSMDKDKGRIDYPVLEAIVWEEMDKRPIAISQAFDVTNSPIRRLSALALAKQDCRTYAWVLQPNQELMKLDPLPEDPNADASKNAGGAGGTPGMAAPPGGGTAPPGGPPAGGKGMVGPGMGGMGIFGIGGAMQGGNATPNNGIERNRYLQPASKPEDKDKVSPPGRHLPLAVRLVVEQSHMHDVLLALVNSRLRVQITQVEYEHDKDYVPEPDENNDNTEGAGKLVGNRFLGGLPGMMYGPMSRQARGMPLGGNRGAVPANPRRMGDRGGKMQARGGMGGMGAMGMGGIDPRMMRSLMGGRAPSVAMLPGARTRGMPQSIGDTGSSKTLQEQHDDNLVDITIYGIATLYRHPDPPAGAEQLGQPAPPGGPPPAPAGKK